MPDSADYARDLSVSLWRVGDMSLSGGRFGDALVYFRRVFGLYERLGERRYDKSLFLNLALAELGLGNVAESRDHYHLGLALAKETADRNFEGIYLNNLGELAARTGQFEESIALYGEALALAKQSGETARMLPRLAGLGYAHQWFGHLAEARVCYQEALALEVEEPSADAALGLGILSLEDGHPVEAPIHLCRALELSRAALSKNPDSFEDCYRLALALLASGRAEESLSAYQRALGCCSARGVLEEQAQHLDLLQRASPAHPDLAAVRALLDPMAPG